MRLATIRTPGGTRAVRVDDGVAVGLPRPPRPVPRIRPVSWTTRRWCPGPGRSSASG
jgi:hypothetical protein